MNKSACFLTVDSRWMRRLGLPRASMISRAYSSLWGLLILSSSFQHKPSPFYTRKQVWQKNTSNSISINMKFRNGSLILVQYFLFLILRDRHQNLSFWYSARKSLQLCVECVDWPCRLRCSGTPAASWDTLEAASAAPKPAETDSLRGGEAPHSVHSARTHTYNPFIPSFITSCSASVSTSGVHTHLRVVVDLLGVGAGRFEAGQHLQQVEQRSEVWLLEEQQHGDVLLLRGRQTGGRQLDALPLPLPPRSSQRHKHHLGSDRQTPWFICAVHFKRWWQEINSKDIILYPKYSHLHVFEAQLVQRLLVVVCGQLVAGGDHPDWSHQTTCRRQDRLHTAAQKDL